MTEEQKRFKIQKRTSYEEQISKESKLATLYTFLIGVFAEGAAVGLTAFHCQDRETTTELFDIFIWLANNGAGVACLKWLMEAISRKTMLQGMVEDINNELEMSENEESRSMR